MYIFIRILGKIRILLHSLNIFCIAFELDANVANVVYYVKTRNGAKLKSVKDPKRTDSSKFSRWNGDFTQKRFPD